MLPAKMSVGTSLGRADFRVTESTTRNTIGEEMFVWLQSRRASFRILAKKKKEEEEEKKSETQKFHHVERSDDKHRPKCAEISRPLAFV
jgi:hypothetical protein